MPAPDKITFLREAPSFYAVAIGYALSRRESSNPVALRTLEGAFDAEFVLFNHPLLIRSGLAILSEAGLVSVYSLTFGPPLVAKTDTFAFDWCDEPTLAKYPVFNAFSNINSSTWLVAALEELNDQYLSLGIQDADFDAEAELFAPLPLDRTEPEFVEMVAKVDEALDKIEADNAYAADVPGERDHVVQSLKSFRSSLRENAQITAMQIKTFALDPLVLVVKRFGPNAVGVVAGAAKDAVVTFLKTKFGALLASLFSGW